MTDSFVTQCPHCQTSFRVSHTQLSVARGVVRCGACLQVFNAARQLLEQSAGRQEPVAPPPVTPAQERRAAPISLREWSANELDLDKLDLDGELARLEQREIQPAKAFRDQPGRDESFSASRDEPLEAWNEKPFGTHADDEELHQDDPVPPIIERDPPLDEAPRAADPRTEPSLSLAPPQHHEPTIGTLRADDDLPARGDRLSAIDADDDDEEADEPAPRPGKHKHERSEPNLRDAPLLDLMDDPLQLDWQKRRTPWGKRLLWMLLTLVAALALAGQYVWYHFDELARQDQYRPLFQQVCPSLGCNVPSKVDIDKIKSSNLVVRSHPDFNGALVVDAIIYNRAAFSQPFPLLELRFADLNGHLIASRRFKPGEYLSGELAGGAEMPPQTPIHISLDILDPGPKAVNYSLSFRSPE
ncbi:hypothetical protein PMM47T1_11382 [Pseudomonas sp. M47T1]|uniref:DUF3426 domain-containing protein n=1 Tax=unclassified Pseudomonas TaxID=196821 RepID=UPI00026085BC|nr:DUF3426 domain-containing protein [Pseudomonas sp. M47T1]EIK96526.1 hypothetical protein PMM47T1_11382 [Pseudomonas sp. M47T1]